MKFVESEKETALNNEEQMAGIERMQNIGKNRWSILHMEEPVKCKENFTTPKAHASNPQKIGWPQGESSSRC